MYAVVQTGGKQYRVAPGDYITVERLPGESGEQIQLKSVLLVDHEGKVTVGAPLVKEAFITATIVEQNRAPKIIVFKKKRRQNYRRKKGHRQEQTVLFVNEIKSEGVTAKAEKAPKIKAAVKPESEVVAKKKAAPAPKEAVAKKPAAKKPAVKKSAPAKKATEAKKATATKKVAEPKKVAKAKKPTKAKKD